ncbi:MAG: cytochrome P450 [Synechococcaceae bacterium WBB_3_034]|nr:cytochrome P450 [Synechococcaceae bacterium WBB_3_034]
MSGCPMAPQPRHAPEPVYPRPAPYQRLFVWRLLQGLRSWFGLLSDVDFRIPIGSVRFLGLNLFLVNQPAAVKRVLVDAVEDFPKHPFTLWILEPLIGRAIFSVNGAEWARQRRLLDQAFQVAQLRRVLPQMRGAVEAMLARLEAAAGAGGVAAEQPVTVEIDQEMTLVTADVIVRTILSRPLEAAEAAGIFGAFARYPPCVHDSPLDRWGNRGAPGRPQRRQRSAAGPDRGPRSRHRLPLQPGRAAGSGVFSVSGGP